MDENQATQSPNWLQELEARREKRIKPKIGHESGAGAPCRNCDDCPGLDLHFWRKICKNCKCGKESHDVQDDDMYGWAQFQLLGSKPNKARKIVLPGKKEEVELEWTPKGQKEVVEKFLKDLPPELLPVKGSAAAQERKQLLQKQIPLHDIDPTLCHALTEEEVTEMNAYINHVKDKSVGVGHIVEIKSIQAKAQLLSNRVPGQLPHSQMVALQGANKTGTLPKHSKSIEELVRNLQNLNLYYMCLEDVPQKTLTEVQFGMRDIVYDTQLNYDKKTLDNCLLEVHYDPNKNYTVLRAKRDENNKINTGLQERVAKKLPVYNLYQCKLDEIPVDILKEVHFGLRDIDYDNSVNHSNEDLNKYGLKPKYNNNKRKLYLVAKDGLKPIVDDRSPIYLGDLNNLYPSIYNNMNNLYPNYKGFEDSSMYGTPNENYGQNFEPYSPGYQNKDDPNNKPRNTGIVPPHLRRALEKQLQDASEMLPANLEIRDLKYPTNQQNLYGQYPNSDKGSKSLPHYQPGSVNQREDAQSPSNINQPYVQNYPYDQMKPNDGGADSTLGTSGHMGSRNILPHYTPTKFNKYNENVNPQNIGGANDLSYDPNELKSNFDPNNPLSLPRYSDFVKNALAKIDHTADQYQIGETGGYPDFDFPPPPSIPVGHDDISESLRSPNKTSNISSGGGGNVPGEYPPPRPNLPAGYGDQIYPGHPNTFGKPGANLVKNQHPTRGSAPQYGQQQDENYPPQKTDNNLPYHSAYTQKNSPSWQSPSEDQVNLQQPSNMRDLHSNLPGYPHSPHGHKVNYDPSKDYPTNQNIQRGADPHDSHSGPIGGQLGHPGKPGTPLGKNQNAKLGSGDNQYGKPTQHYGQQQDDNYPLHKVGDNVSNHPNYPSRNPLSWQSPHEDELKPQQSSNIKDLQAKLQQANLDGHTQFPYGHNVSYDPSKGYPTHNQQSGVDPREAQLGPHGVQHTGEPGKMQGSYSPRSQGRLPSNNPNAYNVYENVQSPSFVNIGGINDITYPGLEVKSALNKEHDLYDPEYVKPPLDTITTLPKLPSCHNCKKDFEESSIAVGLDRTDSLWHADCFRCAGCNQRLADMMYFYDKDSDNVYCGRDYAKIRGFQRCKACDELIFTKEYCLAENDTFHIKHFCCYECDEPLAGKNYVLDEETSQPMCLPCYEKTKANRCNGCKKLIQPDEQGAVLQGVHFHTNDACFCCKMCRKPLLGLRFMFKNTNLYCSAECFRSDQ